MSAPELVSPAPCERSYRACPEHCCQHHHSIQKIAHCFCLLLVRISNLYPPSRSGYCNPSLKMHFLSLLLIPLPLTLAQYGNAPAGALVSPTATSSSASSSSSANADATSNSEIHEIMGGQNGCISTPNSLTADTGDTVRVHFFPGQHSVAQSTFQSPCVPSGPNAIYSDFINPAGSGPAVG